MIFQHTWQQVLSGEQTQTRRLVEFGDYESNHGVVTRFSQGYPDGRIVYEVGKTYSVQPGRGQASVGRIKLLAIRRERVQGITPEDARDEGINSSSPVVMVFFYSRLWDKIHTAKGKRWQDNPEVWVLEFRLCKDGEK